MKKIFIIIPLIVCLLAFLCVNSSAYFLNDDIEYPSLVNPLPFSVDYLMESEYYGREDFSYLPIKDGVIYADLLNYNYLSTDTTYVDGVPASTDLTFMFGEYYGSYTSFKLHFYPFGVINNHDYYNHANVQAYFNDISISFTNPDLEYEAYLTYTVNYIIVDFSLDGQAVTYSGSFGDDVGISTSPDINLGDIYSSIVSNFELSDNYVIMYDISFIPASLEYNYLPIYEMHIDNIAFNPPIVGNQSLSAFTAQVSYENYYSGYSDGYFQGGEDNAFANGIGGFLASATNAFLSMPIFGVVSLGGVLLAVVGVALFIFFLKLFAGG